MFRSSTIIRELALKLAKNAQHATHTPFHDMLPHNRIINNDEISPNVLTLTLASFSASSLIMVEDRNMWE